MIIIKQCKFCGKDIPLKSPSHYRRCVYCSRACLNKATKTGKFHKGRNPLSVEERKKKSATIKKLWTPEFKKYMSEIRIGKRCGVENTNWRGGITSLRKSIRTCFKYRLWRSDVFTRDDYTCQKCGVRGCYLHAHHIKSFKKIIEEYKIKTLYQAYECAEFWNINNGMTLCKKCHGEVTWLKSVVGGNNGQI